MTLNDISVKKYIALCGILKSNSYPDAIDREVALLSCLTGKSEDFYLNLTLSELSKCSKEFDFIKLDTVEAKPTRFINANGKMYAPVYDFSKLSAGQFADATYSLVMDAGDIIENIPKILASICIPTKSGLFGRKLLKYGSIDRNTVIEDMEAASILDAYSIATFFRNAWDAFMINGGHLLISEAIRKKDEAGTPFTGEEKAAMLVILEAYGDGVVRNK